MAYELRMAGHPAERFDDANAAEQRAREIVRADADAQLEIVDLATGKPYAPGASQADRDDLSRKVGF